MAKNFNCLTNFNLQLHAHTGSSLADYYSLKLEAIRSSETSVYTIFTRRHIPEDGILQNLKSYNFNENFPQRIKKNLSSGLGSDSGPETETEGKTERRNWAPHKVLFWRSLYNDWLRAGLPRGPSSSPGVGKNFLFSKSSRLTLGYIQPPIQWVLVALSPGVKRPRREANHSPSASAEVKKTWIYTSTPSYVFMA
jgi:hypothetical protein